MKKQSNLKTAHIDQHQVDNTNKVLTTNDGVPVYDNNNTLKAGERGPSLQQDHIFFDKLMHFDRERIPERVVHARGSGAHGIFEATADMSAEKRDRDACIHTLLYGGRLQGLNRPGQGCPGLLR